VARILLLEDNPAVSEALAGLLRSDGHEVCRTPSGEEAVLLAARDGFDLVLADLQVEDLSGFGALQGMLDVADAPVIVLSGMPGAWEEDALRLGAAAVARKDSDVKRLLELVDAQLAAGRTHGGLNGDVQLLDQPDLQRIAALPDEALDALPFGLIRVDDRGIVTACNAFEAIAGGIDPCDVVGQPLRSLAPCLLVQRFLDSWRQVRERPGWEPHVLRYLFPHHGATCVVNVRLFYDHPRRQLWLFVSKRPGAPRAARA
jgi:photoactive yellow protein